MSRVLASSYSRRALWLLAALLMLSACELTAPQPVPEQRASATPDPAPDPITPEISVTDAALIMPNNNAVPLDATLPPLTPTPLCDGTPRNRLIVAERGVVRDEDPRPVNVREGPNTNYGIVAQLGAGTVFFVVEGPVCSERYSWYHIRYTGRNGGQRDGWIAEGDGEAYYVEPYLPG